MTLAPQGISCERITLGVPLKFQVMRLMQKPGGDLMTRLRSDLDIREFKKGPLPKPKGSVALDAMEGGQYPKKPH
jgi:hypothetical protein